MASDTPQWYFWTLLTLSLTTVPILIYNFIKHHKEKRRNADLDKRLEFISRGNISGKRQVFTLIREPFKRDADDTDNGEDRPTTAANLKGLVGVVWEREKTLQLASKQAKDRDGEEGTSRSSKDDQKTAKWHAEHLLKVKKYEPS